MTHPILALQATLVAAVRAASLTVFDAPPADVLPPQLFHLMTETSPLAVALAGAIGLFFIFDELKILD